MKVLFVTRKFPPSIGGMQLFAYDLYNSLSKKQTIKLVKWGGSNKALPIIYPYLFCISFIKLLRGGIDVIHIQDGLLAPIGLILSKIFRKPYVVVIHGLDITYEKSFYTKFVVPAVIKANKVICISQAAELECTSRGVSDTKTLVLTLAVKDDIYQSVIEIDIKDKIGLDINSQTLLTVGRLVKRKGVAWFVLNVMPELVKKFPNLVYLVVGDGPEQSNIDALIVENKLQQNVKLLGKLEGELYRAVYNQADVFVMPNINIPKDIEGFGLVLLEASLCRKPIVASDTEGIKDAVTNDKNGILVPVESSSRFIDEISKFLSNQQYSNEFGTKSRNYTLENYNWSLISDQYIKVYKDLIR